MAYTFTDHYRPVRLMMRVDGLVVGLGLGTLLLIYPVDLLMDLGFDAGDPAWPARVAGSALIGLGIGLFAASAEPELRAASLLTAMISNVLIAVSLLLAYFQGELSNLSPWGLLLLIVIFVTCLVTGVLPIPYMRGLDRVGTRSGQ
ncbi:MAG: hypothetical protein R2873_05305 [Caldilineaceae bacterium]|nr:hypothetical protein [Caldilineaceae bacterium]